MGQFRQGLVCDDSRAWEGGAEQNSGIKAASICLYFLGAVEERGTLADSGLSPSRAEPIPGKLMRAGRVQGLRAHRQSLQRVQYRQKYSGPGTGSGTGGARAGTASGVSWWLSEPCRGGLDWLVESRSAGHRAPEMAQESRKAL